MIGIATIVPTLHLEDIKDDTYFMALSHLCTNLRYLSFYQDRAAEGKYVILDNSTVELGHPVDPAEYLYNAEVMGADEVLLPDYLYDLERTIDEGVAFLKYYTTKDYRCRIMAVPQGRNINQWLDCASIMVQWPEVTRLGISRRYRGMTRKNAAEGLRDLCERYGRPDITIHLLGCHEMPEHDVFAALQLPYVDGVDSSLPSLFSAHGLIMKPGDERPPGSIDFRHSYQTWIMSENLSRWRSLCQYGGLVEAGSHS